MKKLPWFEVSQEGLKQLQDGKPKHFVFRELIQNAWDEAITFCWVNAEWARGKAKIQVKDDSPEGFRYLDHAFTLFAPTYKRGNVTKRGRFNLGEKQVLSVCETAKIHTTKGTVEFDKDGRSMSKAKTKMGTEVELLVKMSREEFDECLNAVRRCIVPKNVQMLLNGELLKSQEPYTVIEANLLTEWEQEGCMKRSIKGTKINVYPVPKGNQAGLFEMGLWICDIESKYDLDVQQKVPLSSDRETVPQSFLSSLFAQVLNVLHGEVKPDEAGALWVRMGMESKEVNQEAVKEVVEKRYGDKVVIANPFDKVSIDDALANGYRVVYGSELSKEEWTSIRGAGAILSSSEVFGKGTSPSTPYKNETVGMEKFRKLAIKIAQHCLGNKIRVDFAEWDGNVLAQYGNGVMCCNVRTLRANFFVESNLSRQLELIIHEICHANGMHTEASYHHAICAVGVKLALTLRDNPKFLEVGDE